MNESGNIWCDVVCAISEAIMALCAILGVVGVNSFFEKKKKKDGDTEFSGTFDDEINDKNIETKGQNATLDNGETLEINHKSTVQTENLALREFWQRTRATIPCLADRSLPTRRFWSVMYKKGICIVFVILESRARVELYIDNGNEDWNLDIYGKWQGKRNEIEKDLQGLPGHVIWFDRPNRRSKGMGVEYEGGGLSARDKWDEIVDFYGIAESALRKAIDPIEIE